MYDIITMGSNTVDVFVHTDQSGVIDVRSKNECEEFISYPVGSKMLITKLLHNIGGNGANTAVSFARLGLKTAYLGKTGKDYNGQLIIKALKKEKIDFIGAKGDESGFSIILDSIEHDRTILAFKGCNNDLRFNEIKKSKLKAKWFYLSTMLGESLHSMQRIVEIAREKKIRIGFNPSSTLLENETKAAINLLRFVEVLVLNKEEAESLVGKDPAEINIKKLLVYGPKTVVITQGEKGVVAYKDGYYYFILPKKDLKVVETTGAGDAFASTLVAGLILDKPFEYCIKMAVNNAESVIGNHGAQNGLLSRKELFELVNKDDRKAEKRKG
ncbi:carbohydrate kinase family protein [Candidatus Woesearchaeota archaeon]|nr:carbohydrate kinase family protein [Candidatus Woesearchaeota archaeon]